MPMKKKTPEKMIKAWLLANQDLTNIAIGEKLKVHNGTIGAWIAEVENTPDLLSQAKLILAGRKPGKKVKAKSKKKIDKLAPNTARLKDEVEFLRWWNTGERRGYVTRLLNELDK